ncbi:response regulator [Pseudomonas sp. nanlin1]|uniref:response regulator n=1 Tax=Pseudomonas sp. nanlin1 TaxID=3040605 RepID=UPI00388D5434
MTAQHTANCRQRVLIIEDETLVAMLLEDMLDELGYAIVAHASGLPEALALASTGQYEMAVLDINIIGGNSFPVAAVLDQRGIPFIFCSGYGQRAVPEAWAHHQCVGKPFTIAQLSTALEKLL